MSWHHVMAPCHGWILFYYPARWCPTSPLLCSTCKGFLELGACPMWISEERRCRMAPVSISPPTWASIVEGSIWSRLLGKLTPLSILFQPGYAPSIESWLFCHWFLPLSTVGNSFQCLVQTCQELIWSFPEAYCSEAWRELESVSLSWSPFSSISLG